MCEYNFVFVNLSYFPLKHRVNVCNPLWERLKRIYMIAFSDIFFYTCGITKPIKNGIHCRFSFNMACSNSNTDCRHVEDI